MELDRQEDKGSQSFTAWRQFNVCIAMVEFYNMSSRVISDKAARQT